MIRLAQYDFEGPFPLGDTELPEAPGVYAILTTGSLADIFSSRSTVYYVGQAANIRERLSGHEKLSCCRERAGFLRPLEIAYLLVREELELIGAMRRMRIEEQVIGLLDPPCNDRLTP